MADQIGAIEYPPAPAGNSPVPDRLLDAFAGYLSTYVNAILAAEWSRLTPGSPKPILTVVKTSSKRAWFDDKQLPALYLFRRRTKPHRLADDLYEDQIFLDALWIVPLVDGEQRERRDPFMARVSGAIEHCLKLGRHPYWVDPGDEDPDAATLGSVLTDRAGLARIPSVSDIDFEPNIRIRTGDGELHDFDAVLVTIDVVEIWTFDASLRGEETALTSAVSQGGGAFVIESEHD